MSEQQNTILVKLWMKNPQSNKSFTMLLNFLLGVIPGVLYITRNVFIHDEIKMKQASFKNTGYWLYLTSFLFDFIQTTIQVGFLQRLMSVSLVRSYFVGQLISLVLILTSTSNKVISGIRYIVPSNDKLSTKFLSKLLLIISIICVSLIPFVIYKYSSFSELSYGT